MKLITFVVPCFNSAEYMRHCIDTLLAGGDEAEIIIVNDGSADGTGVIADGYAERFPGMVRVFHQKNSGYGEGVNRGLEAAAGLYFKIVDSDDWVDEGALRTLLDIVRGYGADASAPDLLVCNYVYEHAGSGARKIVHYRRALPRWRVFAWEDTWRFGVFSFMLMHALVYKTALLRDTAPRLPPHTFYVDNILAYQPLPAVKTIRYTDLPLYHYYLGRPGQTVDEQVLARNIGQHARVIRILLDTIDYRAVAKEQPRLAKYLRHGLSMMMLVSSLVMLVKNTDESLVMKAELWEYLKARDPRLYSRIRYRSFCVFAFLPGKAGRKAGALLYHAGSRVIALAGQAIFRVRAFRAKERRA